MYKYNPETSTIFISATMEVVIPNTQEYIDYINWLALNNTPEKTDYLTPTQTTMDVKSKIIKKYTETHEPNGVKYYQEFKAFLINDLYQETITEVQAIETELYLESPMLKVKNNGDWKTARYLLQQMSNIPTHIVPYHTKALTEIDAYIATNYED